MSSHSWFNLIILIGTLTVISLYVHNSLSKNHQKITEKSAKPFLSFGMYHIIYIFVWPSCPIQQVSFFLSQKLKNILESWILGKAIRYCASNSFCLLLAGLREVVHIEVHIKSLLPGFLDFILGVCWLLWDLWLHYRVETCLAGLSHSQEGRQFFCSSFLQLPFNLSRAFCLLPCHSVCSNCLLQLSWSLDVTSRSGVLGLFVHSRLLFPAKVFLQNVSGIYSYYIYI